MHDFELIYFYYSQFGYNGFSNCFNLKYLVNTFSTVGNLCLI